MTLVPSASWYTDIIAAVDQQQAGIKDHLGRPWAQHFERVALRLIFRKPDATRAHIEAALLHDAMMERGGGRKMLDALGVSREAREIIEIQTLLRTRITTAASRMSAPPNARSISTTSANSAPPAISPRSR